MRCAGGLAVNSTKSRMQDEDSIYDGNDDGNDDCGDNINGYVVNDVDSNTVTRLQLCVGDI